MNKINLGKGVYVNELAHVSGEVTLGDYCNLWPGASVRGDRSSITIGEGSNVQDNATIHSEAKTPVNIGKNVTIGHNAVVHGATVEDNVIIGMGAIVLDGAVIGRDTIIGAGAVIGGGKVIPAGSVVVGNPFKILRETRPEEVKHITENAIEYVEAAKEYLNGK
jgi:carbonic anhydrase/acetyltransferase-like protein (isoleucine patch superfamily)